MPHELLRTIAKICIEFRVDGHRADIMIDRTARTNAAYEGREQVIVDDIIEASELVLLRPGFLFLACPRNFRDFSGKSVTPGTYSSLVHLKQ
jgi:hypothetical protein